MSRVGSVLFAAGRGTRMRPLSERIPKPALPVLDVPLVAYALARVAAGNSPVVVNVSHLEQAFTEATHRHIAAHRAELFIERPDPFGAGGTLRALGPRLDDSFVTHNADVLTDLDLEPLVDAHSHNDADGTIAVRSVDRGADFEVSVDGSLRPVDRRVEDVSGVLFLGVAVWDKSVIALIPDERPAGLAGTVLGPLARAGRLAAHHADCYWTDVGTPGRYLDASLDVLAGVGPQPSGGMPGDVVEVDGGRAYVGAGAVVERAHLGPGAIVLAGAVVEAGARVEEAIVWPGERVPGEALLSRCVWAGGVAVPAPRVPPLGSA